MYSLLAMLCLAVAVEATAQEVERERADFELGRATEILANIMREFEVGFVDEVKVDDLLNSAVMGMVHISIVVNSQILSAISSLLKPSPWK